MRVEFYYGAFRTSRIVLRVERLGQVVLQLEVVAYVRPPIAEFRLDGHGSKLEHFLLGQPQEAIKNIVPQLEVQLVLGGLGADKVDLLRVVAEAKVEDVVGSVQATTSGALPAARRKLFQSLLIFEEYVLGLLVYSQPEKVVLGEIEMSDNWLKNVLHMGITATVNFHLLAVQEAYKHGSVFNAMKGHLLSFQALRS